MKKFVVGYMNFFENELSLTIIEADNEVQACKQRLLKGFEEDENTIKHVTNLPDSLEEIKEELFDIDILIEVIEI